MTVFNEEIAEMIESKCHNGYHPVVPEKKGYTMTAEEFMDWFASVSWLREIRVTINNVVKYSGINQFYDGFQNHSAEYATKYFSYWIQKRIGRKGRKDETVKLEMGKRIWGHHFYACVECKRMKGTDLFTFNDINVRWDCCKCIEESHYDLILGYREVEWSTIGEVYTDLKMVGSETYNKIKFESRDIEFMLHRRILFEPWKYDRQDENLAKWQKEREEWLMKKHGQSGMCS